MTICSFLDHHHRRGPAVQLHGLEPVAYADHGLLSAALLGQINLLHTSNPDLMRLRFQLQAAQYRPDLVRAIQLYYGLAILGNALKWPVAIVIALLGGLCMWRAAPADLQKRSIWKV